MVNRCFADADKLLLRSVVVGAGCVNRFRLGVRLGEVNIKVEMEMKTIVGRDLRQVEPRKLKRSSE
jgi:hypothetical protein